MTGDDLADGVVEILNGIAAPVQAFEAVNEQFPTVERESSSVQVQVWPFDMEEEVIDRDGAYQVTCGVQVQLTAPLTSTRTRADMLDLLRQLREALRGTEIDGAKHRRTTVTALWDGDAERNRMQYVGGLRAVYEAYE